MCAVRFTSLTMTPVRLDIFSAQTRGQMSPRQPLDSVFQPQMTQKHGAIDVIDDKSQIFVHTLVLALESKI